MLGSLSSGSSGPSPVISSRISETKSLSSCAFSASRSARTYCDTSCVTCARICSSGSLSSADRLISSISFLCSRTLASSSLSVSRGFAETCAAGAGAGAGPAFGTSVGSLPGASGNTVQATPSGAGASSAGAVSGVFARRVVNRPAIMCLPCRCQLELLQKGQRFCFGLRRVLREHEPLELRGDLIAGFDVVERHAAVDRFAHEMVVVGYDATERIAKRLLYVLKRKARREHALMKAVDDDLRFGPVAEALADRTDELLAVAQARHGRFADDVQPV